jgi:hypothetical protein
MRETQALGGTVMTGIKSEDGTSGFENFDGCRMGKKLDETVRVTIYIQHGVSYNRPTRTTVLWKHEERHARDGVPIVVAQSAAMNLTRSWCLPLDCHLERFKYMLAVWDVFEHKETFLSKSWDGEDYEDLELAAKRRKEAESSAKNHGISVREATASRKKLEECIRLKGMTPIPTWPKLPSL